MTNKTALVKLPSLSDLVKNENMEENALMVILNQNPPQAWIKVHPFIRNKKDGKPVDYLYIPRERLEYTIARIYGGSQLEIKEIKLIANSVVTTVRVHVTNPVTGEKEWQDGVGAQPIQTDKDSGAIDFNNMKTGAIQMAAPASETYAYKDAVEKFGKIFGKDLNVDPIEYDSLLKIKVTLDDIVSLYEQKKDKLKHEDQMSVEAIIEQKDETRYNKVYNTLNKL